MKEKNIKNTTENKVIETKLGKVEYKENTDKENKIKEKHDYAPLLCFILTVQSLRILCLPPFELKPPLF